MEIQDKLKFPFRFPFCSEVLLSLPQLHFPLKSIQPTDCSNFLVKHDFESPALDYIMYVTHIDNYSLRSVFPLEAFKLFIVLRPD
jgi:hypothetical protein